MSSTSRIGGAVLSFFAERVDIPLATLTTSMATGSGARLERPDIVPPKVSDELELGAIRELALGELLRHADSGRARVRLALPAKTVPVGPLSLELKEGTTAVIDLEIRRGQILRAQTRGTLEPAMSLPLGMTFRGLYLGDDGSVIADISGFPDVNLSQLTAKVPRIPAALGDVLTMLGDEKREGENAFDPSGLSVEARDVVPRSEAFSLGDAGEVVLGPDTRLDIDLVGGELAVRGQVHVLDAHVRGVGFLVEGLTGKGTFAFVLKGLGSDADLRIDASCSEARARRAALALRDGSRVDLGPSSLGRSSLELSRAAKSVRFMAHLTGLSGALDAARVMARIGDRATAVEIMPTTVEGTASLSHDHVEADLFVDGAEASCRDLELCLGLADFAVSRVAARARGQLKAGTDFGVAFSGALDVHAEVAHGAAHLGELHARLEPGSEADLAISQIAASDEGLDALVATGEVRVRLMSGQVPLGRKAALSFSSGAVGKVTFSSVELLPGARWPRVTGTAHVEAVSDAVTVADLVELPRGHATVDGKLALDERGHLSLCDLSMLLKSLDEGAP